MPPEYGFGHLWQQEELSDIDLVLVHQAADADEAPTEAAPPAVVLQRMPAHSTILSLSPFLRAMIARWQRKRPHAALEEGSSDAATAAADPAPAARPELVLTLQDPEQLPAAMAVLAAMYLTKPLPELLSQLTIPQQLQAALLADMWQTPNVSTAAVDLSTTAVGILSTAAKQPGATLPMPAVEMLLGLPTWPDFALPLLPHVANACLEDAGLRGRLKLTLLAVLGDLEAVWADAGLQATLLQLPLPAMEDLLACSELKVASEDTVLFTAQAYVDNMPRINSVERAARKAAMSALAPLIRCPYLSQFWLSAAVLSADSKSQLLSKVQAPIKQLLLAMQAKPGLWESCAVNSRVFRDAPASWLLPRRCFKSTNGVQMQWRVAVADIRQAAQECARGQTRVWLTSPLSAPLGGIRFEMFTLFHWEDDEDAEWGEGTHIGLYVAPQGVPTDMSCHFSYKVGCVGHSDLDLQESGQARNGKGLGLERFFLPFGMGAMCDGWDESSWTSMGLPTTGALTIALHVTEVGHWQPKVFRA